METSRLLITGEENHLGNYRLIAVLGRGGMAVVHLAVMRGPAGFNKLVVLKQLHPQYSEEPEVVAMFLDEARLAARLSHPNVVQTNEVGEDGDRRFMAMEYLEGQPLNRILHRLSGAGGLPVATHLRVIADLLGGLHYAHELTDYDGSPLCIVHRDINPQNVFVTYDGVVKIVDFGIAKARSSLVETKFGVVKGKISYMAPEQARGEPVDRRADIFAVGVMLWQAVTGVRPWKGVTDLSLMKRLVQGQFPSVRAAAPDIPDRLEKIIVRALAANREDRHATAAELQTDLEHYLESIGARVHGRDVGKLISTHFAADRAAIGAAIEAQLRTHNSAAVLLPTLDPPTIPDIRHKSSRNERSRSDPPGMAPSTPASVLAAASSSSRPPRPPEPRLRRDLGAWIGALGIAAISAALGMWLHGGPGAPSSKQARTGLETDVAMPPPPPATSTETRRPANDLPDADNSLDPAHSGAASSPGASVAAPDLEPRTASSASTPDLGSKVHPASSANRPRRKPRRLDATNPYPDP